MAVTPFVTVPPPMGSPATMAASIQALMHNVNLLIVNSQANAQSPNLTGAQVFAKISANDPVIIGLNNQLAQIRDILAKNGVS